MGWSWACPSGQARGAIVDLLDRARYLEEAERILKNMHYEPI